MNGLISCKKLHADAVLPEYKSDGAAGADLFAVVDGDEWIPAGGRKLVRTGIAIELPIHLEAQVRPRSGLALHSGITVLNSPGTIDSDYRGEIGVILLNTSDQDFRVSTGERIAQLVIAPVWRAAFITAPGLTPSKRADGGFGSTVTVANL